MFGHRRIHSSLKANYITPSSRRSDRHRHFQSHRRVCRVSAAIRSLSRKPPWLQDRSSFAPSSGFRCRRRRRRRQSLPRSSSMVIEAVRCTPLAIDRMRPGIRRRPLIGIINSTDQTHRLLYVGLTETIFNVDTKAYVYSPKDNLGLLVG